MSRFVARWCEIYTIEVGFARRKQFVSRISYVAYRDFRGPPRLARHLAADDNRLAFETRFLRCGLPLAALRSK
jgi:hypothetical protein